MKTVKRMVSGLGIGSFLYLCFLFFKPSIIISSRSIFMVFMISIFVSGMLFVFDIEKLSFYPALIIHYLSVQVFVIGAHWLLLGPESFSSLFLSTTFIYMISYIVTLIQIRLTTRQLNQYLKEIKKLDG